ncbi:DUF4411 family protein [Daejeonella sp. H1SJ63]|uniref:DUF4411 family protein n=1 Tax=Daejeonella sp. H1SJ63 TaxID=3034145 RepID=UPI0023EDCD8B|nr:DUF4411 family protein [Daejeonella sp. H1SJ63]
MEILRTEGYWDMLNELGNQNRIFLPQAVADEITKTDDELSQWLSTSKIPIQTINESIALALRSIYAANPDHKLLVDNTRQRSLADPWLIAHAINDNACVVTKENLETAANSKRIKIPNVCNNMGVRWINDFQFVEELNLRFFVK